MRSESAATTIDSLIAEKRSQLERLSAEVEALERARSAINGLPLASSPKRAIFAFLGSDEYQNGETLTPTEIADRLVTRIESSAKNPKRVLIASFYALKKEGRIVEAGNGRFRATSREDRFREKWGGVNGKTP